jgi:hypothetical protein
VTFKEDVVFPAPHAQKDSADDSEVMPIRSIPLGYKLHAEIISFPGGMPGEVALFLK